VRSPHPLSGRWSRRESPWRSPEQINGILISHEHSDHSGCIGALSRKTKSPVFATRPTWQHCASRMGKVAQVEYFSPGDEFKIGDLIVHAFPASHDAVDGCNFTFKQVNNTSAKLAVATDLGFPTKLTVTRLQESTTLILESNHDVQLLMEGPYPWSLKQRVKSSSGHLSNEQAIGLLGQVLHADLRNLILAHLSETNNRPELAETGMKNYLAEVRHELNLVVASQYEPTPLLDV
jgi:phosphoribosyl 1,2-cyclic phosphodiesterase